MTPTTAAKTLRCHAVTPPLAACWCRTLSMLVAPTLMLVAAAEAEEEEAPFCPPESIPAQTLASLFVVEGGGTPDVEEVLLNSGSRAQQHVNHHPRPIRPRLASCC
jgi:hypothetical protein